MRRARQIGRLLFILGTPLLGCATAHSTVVEKPLPAPAAALLSPRFLKCRTSIANAAAAPDLDLAPGTTGDAQRRKDLLLTADRWQFVAAAGEMALERPNGPPFPVRKGEPLLLIDCKSTGLVVMNVDLQIGIAADEGVELSPSSFVLPTNERAAYNARLAFDSATPEELAAISGAAQLRDAKAACDKSGHPNKCFNRKSRAAYEAKAAQLDLLERNRVQQYQSALRGKFEGYAQETPPTRAVAVAASANEPDSR